MKLYQIKKGTKGKLIDKQHGTGLAVIRDWTTRKALSFMDTVIDPVRYHNRPDDIDNPLYNKLAQQGWALFAHMNDSRYILAVPYDDVSILC